MKLEFTIPGKAVANQSFRYTKDGRKYTDKEVKGYANWVRLCFERAYPEHPPSVFFEKSLKVHIQAFFEIPKSYSKKKRELALAGKIRPTVKPDTDNISKNIKDALNGIAYPDDKQVVSETIEKFYDDSAYTIVSIEDIQ